MASRDKIYVNITMNSFQESNLNYDDPVAEYSETRASTIIQNPSEWDMSIIRFSVPTEGIPMGIVPITDYANNFTDWLVGVSCGLNSVSGINRRFQQLTWVPQYDTPKPSSYDSNNPYYWYDNYQYVLNLINAQLKSSLDAMYLSRKSPDGNTTMPNPATVGYAFFFYNSTTNKIELYTPTQYTDSLVGAGNQLVIYIGQSVAKMLPHFQGHWTTLPYDVGYSYAGTDIFAVDSGNLTQFAYGLNTIASLNGTGLSFYKHEQEFPDLQGFNCLSSIVFTTQTLPVDPEFASPSNPQYLQSNVGVDEGTNNRIISSIGDFQASSGVGYELQQGNLIYEPSIYRFLNLVGEQPLQKIDVRCNWVDNFGTSHILKLKHGAFLSLKLLFQKRGSSTSY